MMAATVAAVVLAAGASQRFGQDNKLLSLLAGEPLVRRVVRELARADIGDIVVVTGHERERIEAALAGLAVRLVHNAAWEGGMGGSIAAGVSALAPGVDGAFIVPADMPFIDAATLGRLMAAFVECGGEAIVYAATQERRQRNPVLWPRRLFPELAKLSGPEGGKRLLAAHAAESTALVLDEWALADIDTAADLAAARARLGE